MNVINQPKPVNPVLCGTTTKPSNSDKHQTRSIISKSLKEIQEQIAISLTSIQQAIAEIKSGSFTDSVQTSKLELHKACSDAIVSLENYYSGILPNLPVTSPLHATISEALQSLTKLATSITITSPSGICPIIADVQVKYQTAVEDCNEHSRQSLDGINPAPRNSIPNLSFSGNNDFTTVESSQNINVVLAALTEFNDLTSVNQQFAEVQSKVSNNTAAAMQLLSDFEGFISDIASMMQSAQSLESTNSGECSWGDDGEGSKDYGLAGILNQSSSDVGAFAQGAGGQPNFTTAGGGVGMVFYSNPSQYGSGGPSFNAADIPSFLLPLFTQVAAGQTIKGGYDSQSSNGATVGSGGAVIVTLPAIQQAISEVSIMLGPFVQGSDSGGAFGSWSSTSTSSGFEQLQTHLASVQQSISTNSSQVQNSLSQVEQQIQTAQQQVDNQISQNAQLNGPNG